MSALSHAPTPLSPILLSVTCSAPVNIAVVKYWGKQSDSVIPNSSTLILPLHSSLSGTLHQDNLKTVTSIVASCSFEKDQFWLNGVEDDVNAKRIQQCLREVRKRIQQPLHHEGRVIPAEVLRAMKVHICSENNFPTASGLASSASGFACLAFALTQLFQLKEQYKGEFSTIARMGSGSACRSFYGGFVKWEAGTKPTGSDSIAVQIAPESHWPLKVLILVASQKKKETSSTSGMETSVNTSELINYRKTHVVPNRISRIEKAILERDFHTFATETMKDSNQFHAVCLDTYPPIFYLNHISQQVISLITKYNNINKEIKVCYTFDAGPNAVLYIPEEHFDEVNDLINYHFPVKSRKGSPEKLKPHLRDLIEPTDDLLANIIETTIGPGPLVLSADHSLLDKNGNPIRLVRKKSNL